MALFKFTKAMLAGESIDVYGEGKLVRDFTYIDDIVEGIMRVLDKPATPDAGYDSRNPNPAPAPRPIASSISATTRPPC
jgi:UDP-glucuronate 4-epimerase